MTDRARRAHDSDRADRRLREGSLGAGEQQALARWLARQHAEAPGARELPEPDAAERELAERARASRAAWPELTPEPLAHLVRAQRDFLAAHAARLRERAREGRVRAGLGPPLRLADVALPADGEPWRAGERGASDAGSPARDGACDLASLALELAAAERGDLAERLLSAYAGAADDFGLYGVIDFYERDAALERAAAGAPGDPEARRARLAGLRRALRAALATAARPLVPSLLVAVGGLVASGKSRVSRDLAERLCAPRIEADRVRDALLGDLPGEPLHEAHWAESLEAGFDARVYRELRRRAEIALASGRPLVLDACFPTRRERADARDLARRCGRPFLFVECRADSATVRERLAERDAAADRPGWARIAESLARRWQDADDLADVEHLVLDTTRPFRETRAELVARIPGAAGAMP